MFFFLLSSALPLPASPALHFSSLLLPVLPTVLSLYLSLLVNNVRLSYLTPALPQLNVSEADAKMIRKCVIYRDKNLIAISKPQGLPVQGGSKSQIRNVDRFLPALRESVRRLLSSSSVVVLFHNLVGSPSLSSSLRRLAFFAIPCLLSVRSPALPLSLSLSLSILRQVRFVL